MKLFVLLVLLGVTQVSVAQVTVGAIDSFLSSYIKSAYIIDNSIKTYIQNTLTNVLEVLNKSFLSYWQDILTFSTKYPNSTLEWKPYHSQIYEAVQTAKAFIKIDATIAQQTSLSNVDNVVNGLVKSINQICGLFLNSVEPTVTQCLRTNERLVNLMVQYAYRTLSGCTFRLNTLPVTQNDFGERLESYGSFMEVLGEAVKNCLTRKSDEDAVKCLKYSYTGYSPKIVELMARHENYFDVSWLQECFMNVGTNATVRFLEVQSIITSCINGKEVEIPSVLNDVVNVFAFS